MKFLKHILVFALAISLAFSAIYILSERDQFIDTFYGSSYHIIIPQNSNITIPLGLVSDSIETGSFTVNLGSWSPYLSWNHSSSIKNLGDYNVKANLLVSVAVNKSTFIILEDTYGNVNKTIGIKRSILPIFQFKALEVPRDKRFRAAWK